MASTATNAAISAQLSFPEKLMDIIERDLAPDAVWWLPGNKTFAVHSKNFSSQVLDKYFQRTKFMSFVRKLNQWGFRRIPGQDVPNGVVAYVHTNFRKGSPELLKNICDRKKAKNKAKSMMKTAPPSPGRCDSSVQAAISSSIAATGATSESATLPVVDSPIQSPTIQRSSVAVSVASAPKSPPAQPTLANTLEMLRDVVRGPAATPSSSTLASMQALQALQTSIGGTNISQPKVPMGINDLATMLERQVAERAMIRSAISALQQQQQQQQQAARSSPTSELLNALAARGLGVQQTSSAASSLEGLAALLHGGGQSQHMAANNRPSQPTSVAPAPDAATTLRLLMMLGQRGTANTLL